MKLRMLTLFSVFAILLQNQESVLNAACCGGGCGRGSSIISDATSSISTIAEVLDFAEFFALMPGDNAATVAVATPVMFPQNGPASGSGLITRLNASQFLLSAVGVYDISFQVSVSEPGQLVLVLNGVELAYTMVGRATGTDQIYGTALVRTTVPNSILSINNAAGNSTALTITPIAGGVDPVSADVVILRLQ